LQNGGDEIKLMEYDPNHQKYSIYSLTIPTDYFTKPEISITALNFKEVRSTVGYDEDPKPYPKTYGNILRDKTKQQVDDKLANHSVMQTFLDFSSNFHKSTVYTENDYNVSYYGLDFKKSTEPGGKLVRSNKLSYSSKIKNSTDDSQSLFKDPNTYFSDPFEVLQQQTKYFNSPRFTHNKKTLVSGSKPIYSSFIYPHTISANKKQKRTPQQAEEVEVPAVIPNKVPKERKRNPRNNPTKREASSTEDIPRETKKRKVGSSSGEVYYLDNPSSPKTPLEEPIIGEDSDMGTPPSSPIPIPKTSLPTFNPTSLRKGPLANEVYYSDTGTPPPSPIPKTPPPRQIPRKTRSQEPTQPINTPVPKTADEERAQRLFQALRERWRRSLPNSVLSYPSEDENSAEGLQ
jgi:hypothetical protein